MRPTLRRQAARVVAIDERGRVLLIKAHDPARPDAGSWWELPGGGIERGESSEHACLRELHEEGGVASALMGPVIWTQHVTFDFAGEERPFPLDVVPRVISPEEWETVEAGVKPVSYTHLTLPTSDLV